MVADGRFMLGLKSGRSMVKNTHLPKASKKGHVREEATSRTSKIIGKSQDTSGRGGEKAGTWKLTVMKSTRKRKKNDKNDLSWEGKERFFLFENSSTVGGRNLFVENFIRIKL